MITGNTWTNSASGGINLQLDILNGLSQRFVINKDSLNIESGKLTLNLKRRSIMINFLNLFFDALSNKASFQASLNQLAYSKKQFNLMQEQFESGNKTLVDVSAIENQVSVDELNSFFNKKALSAAMLDIKQILNISLSDSVELVEPLFDSIYSDLYQSDIKSLVRIDPAVKAADIILKQAEIRLKIAKWSILPQLRISTAYGTSYSSERINFLTEKYMPFGNQVIQNRALNFGVNLNIPILNGFLRQSAISQAKIAILRETKEKERIIVDQEKIRRAALQDFQIALQAYYASSKQCVNLKKTRDAMQVSYAAGIARSIEFSKTLLEYNQSEFNLIKARYSLLYFRKLILLIEGANFTH